MTNEDDDLSTGIERLRAAIQELEKNETVENRQQVCIETRAVFAIFEDETHWQGREQPGVKATLIELFTRATSLIGTKSPPLFNAVNGRLKELHERDFTITAIASW